MAKKRILVVDDELGPRESLRMLFKDEFRVETVKSGEEALAFFRQGTRPDLVILDQKMSRTDGLETLAGIQAIAPGTRVIMLTGYGTPETERKARELGVLLYLTKPFDIFELREIIRAETG